MVNGSLDAAAAMPCLLQLGLLAPAPDGLMAAVPPTIAAQLTLGPLRREITRHQRHIAALEPSFAVATEAYAAAQQELSGEIRTISGAETISATLRHAVDGCTTELLTVQPGGRRDPQLLDRAITSELPALRRGVRQRTIYQHAIRSHAPTMEYIHKITAAGAEVRTVGEVTDRLIICDRSTAFIPAGSPRGERALEIRNPSVVQFLAGAFEELWQRAQPVETTPGRIRPPVVVEDIQETILRLLVEGYTDAKIARQLGMSQRTVANHVRRVSDQLGSGSRAQLGYLVATRSLLGG